MSAALGIAGISSGLQLASGVNQAFQEQAYAQLQSGMMQRQMEELEYRNKVNLRQIAEKAEKVTAAQTGAYVMAGVEISGSAMDVISDTMNDAAQAQYMRMREHEYTMSNLAMDKYNMDARGSNQALFLKIASAGLGAGANFAQAYALSEKGSGKKTASGLGQDSFGGTTQYSRDYMSM